MNKINIDKLPKWTKGTNKGKVNWDESVGHVVDFEYNGVIGEMKIIDKNKMKVTVLYHDKQYVLNTDSILKCKLGSLFFKSIWETDRWMCDLGLSEEDAKNHSKCSTKRVEVICPKCKKKKNIVIENMYRRKSISCTCNFNSISYPERFMMEFLSNFSLGYIHQLSKTTFDWCETKRYDFYIPSLNMIIETHGEQHYRECSNFKLSLKEVQENDRLKKELALSNGIEHYIELDCRESDVEWIKKSIFNSYISKVLDLFNVKWTNIEQRLLADIDEEICNYWNNKDKWETASTIANKMNLSYKTVKRSLDKSSALGLCDYDPSEELKKSLFKKGEATQSKPIEVYKDGVFIGVYESATYIDKNSLSIFGERLVRNYIRDVCNGKRKMYKNYFFREVV